MQSQDTILSLKNKNELIKTQIELSRTFKRKIGKWQECREKLK